MKSIKHIGFRPASLPLSADDIVEFHAARLLLLMKVCGTANRLDSLTKMAKLDFFVRYPEFFEVARAATTGTDAPAAVGTDVVESAMVRHHYGPWDKRYYHILAYLEANRLITVTKHQSSYRIALTDLGIERANLLVARPSFATLIERMREIKKTFGAKSGTYLKELIYRLFDEEVGQRPMGQMIRK
ncbi:MAG: hypothetical protein K0U79_18775 [Gammaproteobacteria bacterium]|nr:hypothetical protein [Gammaproteobacteria bacterium]